MGNVSLTLFDFNTHFKKTGSLKYEVQPNWPQVISATFKFWIVLHYFNSPKLV